MKLIDLSYNTLLVEQQLQYLPEGIKDIIAKLPPSAKNIAIGIALAVSPMLASKFTDEQLNHLKNTFIETSNQYINNIASKLPFAKEEQVSKTNVLDAIEKAFEMRQQKQEKYFIKISDMFKYANKDVINQVIDLAHKHERPTFPTAEDIISIVAIESSFNPKAKSKLKDDPAIGLTQIRPGVHNISKEELKSIENQIRLGVEILASYYDRLRGNKEKAIIAYNRGITATIQGRFTKKYLNKYKKQYSEFFNDPDEFPSVDFTK